MRKLIIFNNVTIDGFFSGIDGEYGWAHEGSSDPEFAGFVQQNAGGASVLLFGRKTYDIMASYWPTQMAKRDNPHVAAAMNERSKVVFSKTRTVAEWSNTIVKDDVLGAVRELKEQPGPDLVVLGSGSIVAQLAAADLVDEYQLVINPIILGEGRTLFEGLPHIKHLELKTSRSFKNGKVYVCLSNTI